MLIITDKGHVLGVEAFVVFLGWLLILSAVWSDSAHHVNVQQLVWKKSRALETSIALSDALILTHHVNAWRGCAVFDETLQRARAYIIEESCLQNLSLAAPPSSLVARVSLRRGSVDINYFSRVVDENESCVSLRRPAYLFPGMKNVFVEVLSCA